MQKSTYKLNEIAKLLQFTPAYCKMVLKRMKRDPMDPIDGMTAAELARRLSRPWPPQIERLAEE